MDDNFGSLLRRMRQEAALTQLELADRAGLSVAAVRDLEQRRNQSPRVRTVRALTVALGLGREEADSFYRAAVAVSPVAQVRPLPAPAGEPEGYAVGILGPLLLERGGVALRLGGGRHRIVLARLALTPNTMVCRDELVDLLWGHDAPLSAVNLVHTYVSRLRRLLEPDRGPRTASETLTLTVGGYRLNVDAGQLDLLRFRRIVSEVRSGAGEPERAMMLMRDALGLWRGDAVADVVALSDDPLVAGLANERIDATIVYAGLAEKLARSGDVLPVLRELADRLVLHEPLQARYIAALAATNRQAEALEVFENVRRHLGTELGIDPSPELARVYDDVLHQRVGRQETVAANGMAANGKAAVPFQAPAPPPDFTGRDEHVRRLVETLAGDGSGSGDGPPPLCAVSGVAGIGKTTLALHVASRLRRDFPQGQLFIDLRGASPHPLKPVTALTRFLRAIGFDGRAIPADEDECAAFYRSSLAGRSLLIILDNAHNAAQVRALLPGAGECATIVTSRRRLVDLAGATHLDLGVFSAGEALDLLASTAGAARVASDPAAAEHLATACGRLPIALRIAGARLATRPMWTPGYLVQRLADKERTLDELHIGDTAVEATFQLSYDDLPLGVARKFRLLALTPGPDFTSEAAATMLGTDPAETERDLIELVDANMLQQAAAGRYSYHDLLRLFATRRAKAEEPVEARRECVQRLLDWYLAKTAAGVDLIYAGMVRLPVDVPQASAFEDGQSALAWLDAEQANLVAAVELAAEHGPRRRSWEITDQLRAYFFVRRLAAPWLATGRVALNAARSAGDELAQAAMLQTLGQASWSIGRHDEALGEYEHALRLAQNSGWYLAAAYVSRGIGQIQAEKGQLAEAMNAYRNALDICRAHGLDYVRAVTVNDVGVLYHDQGRLVSALECFTEALGVNERLGHHQSAAANRGNVGMVLRQLGQFDAAYSHLRAALTSEREFESKHGELSTLDELSQLQSRLGRHRDAIASAREALRLARECKDPRAEAAVLATVGGALLASGDAQEALRRYREAFELAEKHPYPWITTRTLVGLARALLATGDISGALRHAACAVGKAKEGGFRTLTAEALEALALAHLAGGEAPEAVKLCHEAQRLCHEMESPLHAAAIEQVLSEAESAVPLR